MSSSKEACLEFSRTINRQTVEVALAASDYKDDEAFLEFFRHVLNMWEGEIRVFKEAPAPASCVDKATILKEASNLREACEAVMNNPDKQNIAQLCEQSVRMGVVCDRFFNG